jgi:glycosyltransferase involved in cell wall biosynthesis
MNIMPPCKVTIAIPTRNRAGYLRLSLASALAQTYENLEVVVSNNACSDETSNVLNSICDPRLRVLYQPTLLGMMQNWNACLSAATGKYFLMLSDDDILEPTAIEEMVDAYEESESRGDNIGFVYCSGVVIDHDGNTLSVARKAPTLENAERLIVAFFNGRRDLWPCVILFRSEDIVQGYDPRFALGADAAQWMRLVVSYGSARFVDRRLARYRVHQNTTINTRVEIWRKENDSLGDFIVEAMRKNGPGGECVARHVRKAVHRMNVRITSELINHSWRSDKQHAFSEYKKNIAMFTSSYGLMTLTKGIVLLMLPDSFRAWVRRWLYSRPNRTQTQIST